MKFKQNKLDEAGLTADDVENYIKTATRETPLGLFQFGKNEKSLVVDGQFKSVKALKDLEIPLTISGQSQSGSSDDQSGSEMSSTGDNASSSSSQSQMSNQSQASNGEMPSVPLSELATITLVGDERESISKTNGKDAVNVQIMKAQDANTVQVAKEAQNKIDEFVKIMMT